MKLSQTIKALTAIYKKYGDLDVICSSDDEGNSYQHVVYSPTIGNFDGQDFDCDKNTKKPDCVCIN